MNSEAAQDPKSSVESPVILDARVVTGSGGGPDKTLLNSPRFLEPLGYRMLCAYLHPPGDAGYDAIRKNAERYKAPLISIPDRGPWDWRVITESLAVCKREKVAVWHGHDYKTNALGLLLKRFWPMRMVTTVHGWVHHTTKAKIYYRVDQKCLPRYERVLCVSEDLLEVSRQCGVPEQNLVLLENGIDADDYRRTRPPAAAKSALGFRPDRFLIGAVGRLEDEKGFDILLHSIAELVRGGDNVHLVIVGEGGARASLERLTTELRLADRVTLPGWRTDVRAYFEAMDAFALSSYREGLPNVVLEAMALEVPVVATRVNGVPRLVQDGRTGLLVEAGDSEGLAVALKALIHNEGLRDLFRIAGRRTVEGRYSFRARMQKLKQIYDELLA
jgi:glycosyltransferase involved in cell wall biosynthesis